jgi:hypothetical protein
MDCTQVNSMLDMLMDDALSDEQRSAMEAHGRECPACAAAIRSTLQMKALFAQMEPEIDVPLEAQARWRGAVRQAAKPQKPGQLRRWIVSVAAVAVVLVGVGAAMMLKAPRQDAAIYEHSAVAPVALEERAAEPVLASGVASNGMTVDAPGAVVEADGMADEAVAIGDAAMGLAAESEAAALSAPACELALRVKDVETACDRIRDLAQEYEAVADVQAAVDGGVNVYVEIDAENAGDFLNAVAPMDASGKAVKAPDLTGGGRLLMLLVLTEQ